MLGEKPDWSKATYDETYGPLTQLLYIVYVMSVGIVLVRLLISMFNEVSHLNLSLFHLTD